MARESFKNRLEAGMMCYEGNLPHHALHTNESWRAFARLATAGYNHSGDEWEPLSRDDILGKYLVHCYDAVKENIISRANPTKSRWVLTSGGWDNVNKLKLVNFNIVGPIAALFHSVITCQGESPSAEYIKDLIVKFIENFDGADLFVQVVMDNCSTNVIANDLIEAHFKYKAICSGCLAHVLNLAFKEIVAISYADGCFAKLKDDVNFFNTCKTAYAPMLHKTMAGADGKGKVYALLGYVSGSV